MNFLGHLYFSDNDPALMHANLFGEYVKGSDYSQYPDWVQRGIRLHRTIDHFIDHHPKVVELIRFLYTDLPRVAGIAIDLYFDHLLAKNWERFHPLPLEHFIDQFYSYLPEHSVFDKQEFWFVLEKMKEGNWLINYRNMDGLRFACTGLSRRISFENSLATAPDVFLQFSERIEETFGLYMEDARIFFDNYHLRDSSGPLFIC